MPRPRSTLPGLAALGLLLALRPASAEPTRYPLTVENCGRTLVFEGAPERVASIGQSTTEILYSLGLADKVVGTAVWFGPVMAGFEAANARVKRLADNDPSFESVVAERPALVATQFEWQVGPQGVVGTPAQFGELGIAVYASPADCEGKSNSGGGDGVRTAPFAMTSVHREIEDLARIFDVAERGEALVAELKRREAAARERIADLPEGTSAVFWFSSPEIRADPFVAGASGAPGYILSALGVRNVVDSQEEWPTVGWETIARADPTVIVAAGMERRRFPADDIEVKREFLRTDPVTSLMPAVREGRVVEMDAQAMNPTIRTIEGIEILADALEAAGLAR